MPGILLTIVIIAAVLCLLVLFLIWPGRPGSEKVAPFAGRNFAHRGLHSKDCTVPENSLTAFRLAAEAGYGIELDIQLSKDGEVVVFHDDTLPRVCGVEGRVDAYTLAELREMRLCGTDERIPLLSEVFEVVAGRSPFIIELKTGPRNRELCEKGLALLNTYQGDCCIESFDPRIVAWFRRNAPERLRGQLASAPKSYDIPKIGALALGNLMLNVIARPEFVAYKDEAKPALVRFVDRHGSLRVLWTAREEAESGRVEQQNDMVIFEFYHPAPRYR